MVPVTSMTWMGAVIPIILLLYLLVWRKMSAVKTSVISAGAAVLVAMFLYKAPVSLIISESGKGLWSSASIIAVTFTAILIYEVSREAGGFIALQRELTRLIPDRLLQVLTLGWCFASFLQGPSGFGVPIAVTAPLLIGIGVKPFWAVAVPLMAHAWANTFGTLALAWEALVQQTSLGGNPIMYWETAAWTGTFTGILCLLAGVAICLQYKGLKGLKHGFWAICILGGVQAGGQLALSAVSPTLCTVIPTTIALGVAFLLAKTPMYAQTKMTASPMFEEQAPMTAQTELSLHEALLPYYILVGVSIVVLLTPSINAILGTWKMSFSFAETSTGYGFTNKAVMAYAPVAWLTHSGFFLLTAAVFSGVYFARKGVMREGSVRRIWKNTTKKSIPASVSVAFLLIMSKVMAGSGQIDILANGTAMVTGSFYALLAPAVGTLGAFMSSSNVSSNILFGNFQESMAEQINKNSAIILAAQTSGAAIGTMFSPSKVLLGTTTAGIVGQEGAIIKKLLGVALIAAIIMGTIVFIYA